MNKIQVINNQHSFTSFLNFQEKDKDDWEKNAYKIMDMLGPNPETGDTGVIDIPDEYVKTKNYV